MRITEPVAVVVCLFLSGCNFHFQVGSGLARTGSGVVSSERRDIGEFRRIDVQGAANVTVIVEEKTAAEIEIDDNLLEIVLTELHGDTLVIKTRESYRSQHDLKVRLSTPQLEHIELSGACKVSASGIKANKFGLQLSGASNAKLSGMSKNLTVNLSGAGSVHAFDLTAEAVTVHLSGAASGEVFASETLDAEISGAGSIKYKGQPKQVKRRVSGAGSISPARE